MGFHEEIEGKGVSSFTISPSGKTVYKKNIIKTKLWLSVLTVIIMCLAAVFIYYSYTDVEIKVCKTKRCLQSTVLLMNCMNETVDPCEDFYEFACGMFETNYPSSDDTDENSWISMISSKVQRKVKKFIAQKNEMDEPEAVHKTRMFYNACLNFPEDQNQSDDETENNYSYSSLWSVWEEIGLDANYLNDTVALDMEIILAKIKIYFDSDIYFGLDIDDDPRNSSSRSLLSIGQNDGSQKFKPKFHNMNTITKNANFTDTVPKFTKYFKIIINKLLNRNQTHSKEFHSSDLLNTTKELSEFDMEFSKILQKVYLSNMEVPKVITLGELQRLTDEDSFKFNWTLYLREVFRDVEPEVYRQLMLENSTSFEIIMSNREYLHDVFSLLFKTPITIIKMSTLTHVAVILEDHFLMTEQFSVEQCFKMTTEYFGMVTGYAMIDTLDESSKTALAEMADNIKWALRKMIGEVSWMDDETKNATYRKLANTKTYLGYPNNYTHVLDVLFRNLNVTDNHLENILLISKFNGKSRWTNLVQEKDWENYAWIVPPSEVNAYSYSSMNAFFMPAAILQSPLYHNGLQAINYGATGSTIGHELTHNYDNTGRMYNELGNVVQWWTDKSYEEYTKRAGCLIDHYNGIAVTSENETFYLNGNLTLDENIADIVGVKEAYYAYQRYVDKHGQEPRLPGMEQYNPEQLFFLGYANQYCHYDKNGEGFNPSSTHSPNTVRVRGVLSLVTEFANAWSCPVGTPMNPKQQKCQIW